MKLRLHGFLTPHWGQTFALLLILAPHSRHGTNTVYLALKEVRPVPFGWAIPRNPHD
jgi:hypothetical protein